MKKKAVVIGSGFGGLSIAIRLLAQGIDVEIIEKNEKIGGHAYQLKGNGYTFDMGPSLITAPQIIESVFKAAGKKSSDYLDMVPLDPFYRIYFHDKTYLDYSGNAKDMSAQLAKFHPADGEAYERFMEYSEKVYDAVIVQGLGATPFHKLATMAKFIPKAMKLSALRSAYSTAAKFFKDERSRFTFSFHPLFIGGNPFKVPSIYLMISYLEKAEGVWYAKGGMYSLVQALQKVILEMGGKIRTSTPVTKIIVKNGKAVGVECGVETIKADFVVSNADLTHTYKNLVDNNDRSKWSDSKFDSVKYSMSSFLLYIGTKKKYPKLFHHNIVLSHRYKELVTDIFDRQVLPSDFSMYIHAPSRTDDTMAPEGCDSICILSPVTNLQGNVNWAEKKQQYADLIIDYMENEFGLEDFRENIDYLSIFTPEDFKKDRNSAFGTPWGFEPVLTQSAYFRPHNRSEDIGNLYFTGAGTHPGGGLPGVMLSAEATMKLIEEDLGN